LNFTSRIQLLEAALKEYYASLQLPPGPPTLPGFYAQPGQSGNPIPPLEISEPNNRPPVGWPDPQGPPDPNGPPGPPIWYTAPPSNDSIAAGYGFLSDFDIPEVDRFFYHYDLVGNVQYLSDANGEAIVHRQYLPFGTLLVDQSAAETAPNYGFRSWRREELTDLLSFGDRHYDPETQLWLQPQLRQEAEQPGSPYLFAANQPWLTPELRDNRPGDLLPIPETELGNPEVARNIAAGSAPAFATPIFAVGTASSSTFDFKEGPEKKAKRKPKKTDQPDSGPTEQGVSTPGGPGDDGDPGETSRQKKTGRFRAAYKLFRELLSPKTDPATQAETAQAERASARRRRVAANRKFTIKPGDWEGAKIRGNRTFAFRPDGSTENLRKPQKVRRRRRAKSSPI
jgi:RHS repeat-associated protein